MSHRLHKLHILGAALALASCTGEPAFSADVDFASRVVSAVKAGRSDNLVIMVGSRKGADVASLYAAHPVAFCNDARALLSFLGNPQDDDRQIIFTAEPDIVISCPALVVANALPDPKDDP